MATTPEEVIREARDMSPSYEERAHPNGTLLRTLDSFEKDTANRVARTYPSILAEIFYVDLPLVSFENGVVLEIQDDPQPPDPDAPPVRVPIYVLPGLVLRTPSGSAQEIELVNLTSRNRPADYCGRVGYLQAGRLYLSGNVKTWQGFSSIELNVVAEGKKITGLQDNLRMPDWCSDLYVGALVRMMSVRERDTVGIEIGQGIIDAVWQTITQQKGAETFATVDSWPGGF